MMPADLRASSFAAYPVESRVLAVQYLAVLQRLPLAVLPSFLQQIRAVSTSFPAEQLSLRGRLQALATMPAAELEAKTADLRAVHLDDALLRRDWVNEPSTFIAQMTAYLWSSAQIDRFRRGTVQLFSALPAAQRTGKRLVMVALGHGVPATQHSNFGRLRKHGILLRQVTDPDMPAALMHALRAGANNAPESYAHWYVDGGNAWAAALPTGVTSTSYTALQPLRLRVLQHMQTTLLDSDAGVEGMQHRLTALTPAALRARELTPDPVLQRFYTELFTQSSGPQVFSTSFVQWTARELMRRAEPHTLLLRYQPRQHHRTLDEMVAETQAEATLDPAGSLRDAEMGAYYTWLETRRIAAAQDITFVVWQEGTQNLLVIAPNVPAGTESGSPLRLQDALTMFA